MCSIINCNYSFEIFLNICFISTIEKDKPLLYIGAHDLAKPRHFVWTATGKEFDFTNWAEFEPNNYENREHCVQIGLYDNSTWNDVDCSLNLGYICEKTVGNEPLPI